MTFEAGAGEDDPQIGHAPRGGGVRWGIPLQGDGFDDVREGRAVAHLVDAPQAEVVARSPRQPADPHTVRQACLRGRGWLRDRLGRSPGSVIQRDGGEADVVARGPSRRPVIAARGPPQRHFILCDLVNAQIGDRRGRNRVSRSRGHHPHELRPDPVVRLEGKRAVGVGRDSLQKPLAATVHVEDVRDREVIDGVMFGPCRRRLRQEERREQRESRDPEIPCHEDPA